jgi:glycosyltransferase involved in cell wall biosynthesis
MNSLSVVIPAYNEEKRIARVIHDIKTQGYDVLVVDDGSTDKTSEVAEKMGARVVRNPRNLGYVKTIKRGFREANSDIIVTIDADGEHHSDDIPRLLGPIERGEADFVLGGRATGTIRISEQFLSWISGLKTGITDSGTGLRAIKRDLALRLRLETPCPCGTLVLEAHELGARIREVPINLRTIGKRRTIAWKHALQFFFLLKAVAIRRPVH